MSSNELDETARAEDKMSGINQYPIVSLGSMNIFVITLQFTDILCGNQNSPPDCHKDS